MVWHVVMFTKDLSVIVTEMAFFLVQAGVFSPLCLLRLAQRYKRHHDMSHSLLIELLEYQLTRLDSARRQIYTKSIHKCPANRGKQSLFQCTQSVQITQATPFRPCMHKLVRQEPGVA